MSGTDAPDLPTYAAAFYAAGAIHFAGVTATGSASAVLDQLGAVPFRKPDKGGLPFLGFLASVYDHVRASAEASLIAADPRGIPPDADEVEPATETDNPLDQIDN